jgi:DNA-binding protein HU-beta
MKKNIPPSQNPTFTSKTDLIASIAEFSGLSKPMSAKSLEILLTSIGKALKDQKKVSIFGFGSFSAVRLPERVGRNPRTQEAITIPSKVSPKFRAGKELKKAIA